MSTKFFSSLHGQDRENGHSMKSGLALKSHKGSQIMTEHVVLSRRQTFFFLQLVVISPFLLFPSVDVSVLLRLSSFFPVGYPDKKIYLPMANFLCT